MRLTRVTFTGADDSVEPERLAEISRQYPFVEWGILFSGKRQGGPRFPSEGWLDDFRDVAEAERALGRSLHLSAHLCGSWVREFMIGRFDWVEEYDELAPLFSRVQINFHGEINPATVADLQETITRAKAYSFIFQVDGSNDLVVKALCSRMPATCSPLFDESGGAGLVPQTWPDVWPFAYCGYAGGLGPQNIDEQVGRIAQAAKDFPFWIDMERKVRSIDDAFFDLNKVRMVCQVVQPMVAVAQ